MLAKNDVLVARSLHFASLNEGVNITLSLQHILKCNEGDKFTFHLFASAGTYTTVSMINVDYSSNPGGALAKRNNYFSLHNVD